LKTKGLDDMLTNSNQEPAFTGGFANGLGGTMWKYEQFRAGRIYAKYMFNTREEAESFASQMTKAAPDLFSRIEPIEARAVWN
jgi:hypothetical protein